MKKIKCLLTAVLIMICMTFACETNAFTDEVQYRVTFHNNGGADSHSYRILNKTVSPGDYITLPKVPEKKWKKGVGWTTVLRGDKVQYKPGERLRVGRDLKFYAVYRNTARIVSFYSSGGSRGSAFAALDMKTASGKSVTLPEVPVQNGGEALGWSRKKNASNAEYLPGDKIKVSKNISLYAVYRQHVTISFFDCDGTFCKSIEAVKGDHFTFPTLQNRKNCTMLGWASSPGIQTNPEYEPGETGKADKSKEFFAVVFDRSTETDYDLLSLPSPDTSKYKKVIFVGDSRTERMSYVLTKEGDLDAVAFTAKGGKGLAWLKNQGYDRLLQEIGPGGGKPTAVVFNMGINDLNNIDNYISFYRKIAPGLISRGCRLYFMSLNPINSENLKAVGIAEKKERKEEWVRSFNSEIKSALCSGNGAKGIYINTYSYLVRNGYGMDSGRNGVESGKDDGLHYTNKTYKRIYKYCIDFINS